MADDNDRWLHRVPGSRELAWVVRSLGEEAYAELLAVDERVTYSPRMAGARARGEAEIAHRLAGGDARPPQPPPGQGTPYTPGGDGPPTQCPPALGKGSRKPALPVAEP